MPMPQATYSGQPVTVSNGAAQNLTFDALDAGTELLDRADPANPTFLAAGVYAITATVAGPPLTPGGHATVVISNPLEGEAVGETTHPDDLFTATLICHAKAGDACQVAVANLDGSEDRAFQLDPVVLVKLS